MSEETAHPTDVPSGGRSAEEYRNLADSLRSRVDLFGKTLAAVATLGTTAVGLSKVGDLFPTDDWGLVVIACGGLLLAAGAAIGVAVRLMKVGQPVFMGADLAEDSEINPRERDEVEPIYRQAAQRFGYSTLTALQERERSLRSAAAHATDPAERNRRLALADDVKAEIEQAMARGLVTVIRRRATHAVSDLGAGALYVLVAVGLVGFALASDKISSDRTDPIATGKACGEAREAGATAAELGSACSSPDDSDAASSAPVSEYEALYRVREKLLAAEATCVALVKYDAKKQRPLENAQCEPVRQAVEAIGREASDAP